MSFKEFIKERRKGRLGPVDLSHYPEWKQIMDSYPFIHDYCNPMDAKGIHIIMRKTAFGKTKCAALYFDYIINNSGTHYCEFSYIKIGKTEESCLRKRLGTAYSCEFKKITSAMVKPHTCAFGGGNGMMTWEHCPPYTFAKIKSVFSSRYCKTHRFYYISNSRGFIMFVIILDATIEENQRFFNIFTKIKT